MLGGIIGAAAGAVGNIFGGISKNKSLKEMMKMVNEQKKGNLAWYNRNYNEDGTQRSWAQELLTHTHENIMGRNRQAAGTAAVMGGTEESLAATKAANAKEEAAVMGDLASQESRNKSSIEQQFMARNDAYDEQLRNLKGQKQSILDIAGGALGGIGLDGLGVGQGDGQDRKSVV